ncbi:hypothetical protein MG293_013251 [Ovis ammon polii]|uniref:Uncharacterized protein n=1 Tax=Ovis ammon polii TaxID=230172 RepID=A0AAD4TYQ6_OVIAM|nr:hypothetical protein MG293_013251 [Ovis ammon polii]
MSRCTFNVIQCDAPPLHRLLDGSKGKRMGCRDMKSLGIAKESVCDVVLGPASLPLRCAKELLTLVYKIIILPPKVNDMGLISVCKYAIIPKAVALLTVKNMDTILRGKDEARDLIFKMNRICHHFYLLITFGDSAAAYEWIYSVCSEVWGACGSSPSADCRRYRGSLPQGLVMQQPIGCHFQSETILFSGVSVKVKATDQRHCSPSVNLASTDMHRLTGELKWN